MVHLPWSGPWILNVYVLLNSIMVLDHGLTDNGLFYDGYTGSSVDSDNGQYVFLHGLPCTIQIVHGLELLNSVILSF